MSVDELSDHNVLHKILSFSRYISQYEDINTVLDVTLENIRDLTDADAGTFYLLEGEGLRFAYVQNDTLFSKDSSNKQLYTNSLLPINDGSIAGYVALTKKILNIHDVAELPAELPFKFNRSYDEASGYRTVSMLVLPMLGVGNKLVAVLQLINSKDENGAIQPFSQAAQDSAEIFALRPSEIGSSERQTIASGWMPRLRSSVTECWVGLVFCSPDGPMKGTRVTWT